MNIKPSYGQKKNLHMSLKEVTLTKSQTRL